MIARYILILILIAVVIVTCGWGVGKWADGECERRGGHVVGFREPVCVDDRGRVIW